MNTAKSDSNKVNVVANSCRACKNEIPESALVCATCGSRQDWRRFMAFTSTVLSLLVALVSVLSIGVPWIIQATQEAKSELRATTVRTGLGAGRVFDIQILVANTGTRPGTLGRTYFRNCKSDWLEMDIPAHWMSESVEIIDAGNSGFVYLSRKLPSGILDVPETLPKAFEVKVEIINFDTSRREIMIHYPPAGGDGAFEENCTGAA